MLKNFKINIFGLLLFLTLLYSCQCPSDIDAPREIKPDQYANVLFVNSNVDFDYLKFKTETANFVIHAYYNTEEYAYQDIIPGIVNVNITSSEDSVVFNSMMDLEKAKPYTFFAFGNYSRVQGMLLKDSINDYSSNNSYFRCVNLGNETPYILFMIIGSYSIPVTRAFKTASEFLPTYSGIYKLEIRNAINDSLMIEKERIEFDPGKSYSLVLRGDYEGIGREKLNIQIVESSFLLDATKDK